MMQQTISLNTLKQVDIYPNRGIYNMLTNKQLEIVDAFRKNFGKKLTFLDIKKETGIKSNSLLQRAIGNCLREGVLTTETIGRSILYNLEINNKSTAYLSLIGNELYKLPEKTLNTIIKEVSKLVPFSSGVIFGSYASNEQRKGSDLDIAIIIPDKEDVKKLNPVLKSIELREIIPLHWFVFTQDEFMEMLKFDKENVGKQIARKHLVFYNPLSFYELIKPWIPE